MRAISIALVIAGFAAIVWLSMRDGRTPLDPPAVLAQVQQLNELATVRYTIQKVVGLTEQKEPIGAESILLIMQARVQAGIDLASMRSADITFGPDRIVVLRLPPAKILNVSVDEKETKVWDRQKTWWAPWVPYSIDLEHRARMSGLDAIKQAALNMGILRQAEQNAETSIRGLLGLAGVKSVRIVPASVS